MPVAGPGAVPAAQRLFFALWPDPPLRRALVETCNEALAGASGRRVRPEHLHITLVFLGKVAEDTRLAIEAAAGAVQVPPFEVSLDRIRSWPRGGVVWFGPGVTPPGLAKLQQALADVGAACGVTPESRPYQPHLTLLRRSQAAVQKPAGPVRWRAKSFELVASSPQAGGPHYRVLRSWPLGRPDGGVHGKV